MKKIIIMSAFALILALPLTSVASVNHPISHAVGQVNVNKADAKALTTVKGIGAKRAQAIVDYRQQHGAFKSMDDLAKVKGISSKMAEKIRSQLKLG